MADFPTLPVFSYRLPDRFVVRIGTTTGTATTGVLGQVEGVTGETAVDRPKDTYRRLGSATATQVFRTPAVASTCELTLFEQTAMTDFLAAGGNTTGTSTFDGTESVTLQVEVFDDADALKHVWRLTSAYIKTAGFSANANESAGKNRVTYESMNSWTLITV